jgi:histidinol-phosphate aminotransferase
VFVANPNNPTGTLAERKEVLNLIENLTDQVLLVLDEAYFEFLDDPADMIPFINTMPNLLLMRTFSKIYGLAGLRVGYGIGHPTFISALEKIRQPFNLNAMAQAAALAALDDDKHLHQTRETNKAGLKYFESEFEKLGIEFVPSHANFILARVGDGQQTFLDLQKCGIITRPMGGYQLPEWIRITVGTAEQNERCLNALIDLR